MQESEAWITAIDERLDALDDALADSAAENASTELHSEHDETTRTNESADGKTHEQAPTDVQHQSLQSLGHLGVAENDDLDEEDEALAALGYIQEASLSNNIRIMRDELEEL
eukprot:SAG31_NODE_1202_length_9417_cov_17.778064_4_plen_112_part_00